MKNKKLIGFIGMLLLLLTVPAHTQTGDGKQALLTVKEIMNAIITPATATVWGAYLLKQQLPEYDAIRTQAWTDFRVWLMSPNSTLATALQPPSRPF